MVHQNSPHLQYLRRAPNWRDEFVRLEHSMSRGKDLHACLAIQPIMSESVPSQATCVAVRMDTLPLPASGYHSKAGRLRRTSIFIHNATDEACYGARSSRFLGRSICDSC